MTYFELYEKALHKLNYEGGTVAEFQKMIEPLNQEIPEKKMKSPEELYTEVVEKFHNDEDKKSTCKVIKFSHAWIPVTQELPSIPGQYVVTISYHRWKHRSVTTAVWNPLMNKWIFPVSDAKVLAWLPIGIYENTEQ